MNKEIYVRKVVDDDNGKIIDIRLNAQCLGSCSIEEAENYLNELQNRIEEAKRLKDEIE